MIIYQFLPTLMLIVGILQIVLFFKVWGMTNDVKKIKRLTSEANNFNWTAAELETLAGDYDKAYNIYLKCFINDIYELYDSTIKEHTNEYYIKVFETLTDKYEKRLDTLKGEYSIDFDKYDTVEKIREQIFRE